MEKLRSFGERENGFYWVKDEVGGWTIAVWYANSWWFIGDPGCINDKHNTTINDINIVEVDENRIVRNVRQMSATEK